MLESNQEMLYGDPSKTFSGVHFVLLGFDLATQERIRSKLVDGGGVDVGRFGPDCTHVIVGKLVYDDPICLAARQEGKTLVTGLWVDRSIGIGMPVNPASIMFRPVRDLNGIPGAKTLTVCLTGYVHLDREYIMTMVGLMGANFSKPLVANKVTHLICYKFEGDKYELAKKLENVKLVNHCWLEDCLRAWQLLPEANYDKSSYELEMMEDLAKDSEDEAEDVAQKQHGERSILATPQNSRCGMRSPSLMLKHGTPRNILDAGKSNGMSDVGKTSETLMTKENETTPSHIEQKENHNGCSEMSIAPGIEGKFCSDGSFNTLARSSTSKNIGIDLVSASKTDWNSPPSSASKFDSIGYSRKAPSKASLPLGLGHVKSNAGSIPMVNIGKLQVDDALNISSSTMEHDRTISNGVHTPTKETLSLPKDAETGKFPEKREGAFSTGSSKLQKLCREGDNETEAPQPTSLTHGPPDIAAHHSPRDNLGVNADTDPTPAYISGTVTPEIVKECIEKLHQTSFEKIKRTSSGSKFPGATENIRHEDTVNDAAELLHRPQNLNGLSPRAERLEVQKSDITANLHFPLGGDANSRQKPLKRKLLAKKTLGSRPSLGRGKALNQKGSIYMGKKNSPLNSATRCTVEKEIEDLQRFVDSEKLIVSPNSYANQGKNIEMKNLLECGNQGPNKTGFVDNENEASDKEKGLDTTVCKGVSGDICTPNAVEASKADGNVVTKDQSVISGRDNTSIEAENVASDVGRDLSESHLEDNAGGEKTTSAKKHPPVKTKEKNLLPVTKAAISEKGERRKGAKCKATHEKAEGKSEKGHLVDRDMKTRPEDNGKDSVEMEKENIPLHIRDQNLNHNKQRVGKVIPESNKNSAETDKGNSVLVSAGQILKVKTEPVWFILSGHKLQRKEYQHVIRRLKGRVCRDSHQWSYQATHFIVPDPIRRTEKFFAAAASGRWILKTDYLTACNEAGKFLAEEPYEWHKNGLSEDGAINLEAPRKWRLMRERTGHGAFYGMRVIIYGDCIVPPLDTLKRVVKAGDGTILATSPPYTRFLQSGIDFAIVSPGMPHVDIWIQEFLRHEIPCVLADYLVEYVCKPGYSLDRHVQYNTHGWAEKSFKKLADSMDKIAENLAPKEDDGIADIPCRVCGSRDRGEVMLICGDEGGSMGCGIGTHIDCCDPPLQEIPEEDWFCPKCSSKNAQKKSRKLTSTSKRKR